DPALAGPGGKIASTIYESFWGKVLLVVLFIAFLPLIILNTIKKKLAEKRARKDLAYMTRYSDVFDWLSLQQRFKDSFLRVHKGWANEDLSDASKWMTDWYLQNQQQVYLENWKSQGVKNICDVKKLKTITPILFQHKNHSDNHEGSKLVVSMTANMNDYLEHLKTGEVVEGSKKYKDVETIWMFTLEDGIWKVSAIEEVATLMSFVKAVKDMPPIESTVPTPMP
ncbi:Tim44-like domain-containing protein, partial [Oleiphilus sp. HI0066]|uniref:Tim44 domain-containing protein n=2 Tax=Oleiphilus TaxID=141450 RepID=UPI0007C352DD